MRALTTSEQLQVWEYGRRHTMARRALYLLAASTDLPVNELAQFHIGRRDALLLKLRELMFGSRVEAVTACPECRDELELTFDIADVITADAAGAASFETAYLLQHDDYEVGFRLPDSNDLQVIAGCESDAAARDLMLVRCVSEITPIHGGNGTDASPESADRLPSGLVKALADKMTQIDTQANVRFDLICPSCRHDWTTIFDIASFLWTEINGRAKRILREVHLIASAYNWGEKDILEMSPDKRRMYLEMLGTA